MNVQKLKVKLAAHYCLDAIDGIYESSLQMESKIKHEIRKREDEIRANSSLDSNEMNYLLGSLDDELFYTKITTELAGEMMIIALYKTIEIAILKMATASELFTPAQLKSFFRMSDLKKHLNNKICNIKTLQHYLAYDELRLINNAIKHSGVVKKELAAYAEFKFKKGQKLKDLHNHYYRLRNNVDRFLLSLQDRIITAISTKHELDS